MDLTNWRSQLNAVGARNRPRSRSRSRARPYSGCHPRALRWYLVGLLAGCAAPDDQPAVSERDSAGIAIVEIAEPGTDYGSIEPVLEIGPDTGAGENGVFGSIAVVTADSAGRIFVLDQQAQHVRVFAPDGKLIRSLGRAGRGPGELSRFANGVMIAADGSVWVADYAQARINVYQPEDGTLRTTIPLVARPGGRAWQLHGDTLVYRAMSIARDSLGRFRTWDGVVRTMPGSTVLDTLLIFDYVPTEIGAPPNLRIPLIMNAALWTRLDNGRLVSSSLDRDFIRMHRQDGTLERIVRHRDWQHQALSDADRTALRELLRQKLVLLGGDASAAQSPNVELWDHWPAITAIRSGPRQTIWVQRRGTIADIDPMAVNSPDAPDRFGGSLWDVLDQNGQPLGVIRFPAGFRPHDLRDSLVYGVSTDSLGVQRVKVLKLRR